MIDVEKAHEVLVNMPNAKEEAHFDKPAYKIKGKIFATFNIENKWVTLKFTPEQQTIFCEDEAFYPVPNKWGQLGWTHVSLDKVRLIAFEEGVNTSYENIVAMKTKKRVEKPTQ
ncbi:MmcQ/YjbR family DNA-binding protein [Runella sp. SP2]|uniref:MmcQ/YjbR family DNA-binding protein n=1 Tax=Runella sp. SP2 TaxID=2268026 RepID=UPI000F084B68|nr:MmcQ/YjbR family DNA-binding protein [Runella sp. SP2]AYQ34295.1 MmcQ/YjbR family DNA-binding protein [Runella sp. SP2]